MIGRSRIELIKEWRRDCINNAEFVCNEKPFSQITQWQISSDNIIHNSKRFFSIIGVSDNIIEQPIILQPEIGILGLLLRHHNNTLELLVQAKTEPGNVDVVQLAPTVQATLSNYSQVHGGKATAYLEYFLTPEKFSVKIIADSLQSEQGTRFYGKYNRNISILVNENEVDLINDNWRWIPINNIFQLLKEDYFINTDMRSVLACCNWKYFINNKNNFLSNDFTIKLFESFQKQSNIDNALFKLSNLRNKHNFNVTSKSLSNLKGWLYNDNQIIDSNKTSFSIRFFSVQALDREVQKWEQPLLESIQTGLVILLCQMQEGSLKFMIKTSKEIGFKEFIQYGPSIQIFSSESNDSYMKEILDIANSSQTHLSCFQSDEGSRFYQSKIQYKIIEIPERQKIKEKEGVEWVSLSQLYQLLKIKGILNNEIRSVIAMLFALNNKDYCI